MANNLRLSLEIAASGAGATVQELLNVRRAIEQTAAQSAGITQLARALGTNYDAARRFADGLRLTPEAALRGVSALRELNAVGASSEVRFGTLTAQLGVTVRQFQALDREARRSGQGQAAGAGLAGEGLAALAFKYNNVVAAIQNLVATAKPAYELLIGSNEKLNAQILASQTNLASTSKLSVGGQEIVDPTAKILASRSALQAAIKQIEKDTESLVGVTSSQVNELFQITLQNAAALNNQSKQFPDAIAAATSLTKGWAAALNVAGVPLNQARQEINSILKGQVDQNSILAKSLNITNDQVRQWQAQGRLVDELNKKLEPYVAGNALAARSIAGIGSNIQDIIERLGRNTGTPLLEPIITALDEVYKFLKENETAITTFFGQLTDELLRSGTSIAEAFAPVGKTLLEIGATLGPIALSAIKGLLQVFVGLATVLAPIANLLAGVVKVFADFAATDLGGVVVQTAAVILVLSQLATIIGGLAVTSLPALGAVLLSTVTTLGTLYTSVVAVAAGNTTLALGIPLVQTALRLLAAEAIALNTALIPLTAAIGLAVLVRTTNDLADANEALEAYGNQIVNTAGAVGNISAELNKLNKIRESGGVLNEEQIKREKQLRAAAIAQAEGIELQIKAQKELTNLSADQASTRDGFIKQLEALRKKLDASTGGLEIQAKELEALGTSYEQLAKKAEAANRNIRTGGGGDPEVFKKSVSELTKTIEQQVKLRQVNLSDAAASLEQIRSDVRVEVDVQQAAKETIVKIYAERVSAIKEQLANGITDQRESLQELAEIRDGAEVKDDPKATAQIRKQAAQQIVAIRKEQIGAELAEIESGKARIEALQAEQRVGEAEGDRQLTELKRQELLKRLEQNEALRENATGDVERQQLLAEQQKLFAEQEKLEGEFEKRSNDRAVAAFDGRRKQIQSLYDLGILDQRQYNQGKLDNDLQQQDLALKQQEIALSKLDALDIAGRDAAFARIAEINSKKEALTREAIEAEKKRVLTDYDEQLGELERFYAERSVSDRDYLEAKKTLELGRADEEIDILKQQAARLGAADEDGREAILAQISKLQVQKIKIIEAGIEAEKKRVLTDYDEQLGELERFYAERSVSDRDYLEAKKALELGRADEEIDILKQQAARLGAADEDGREVILAQISKLQVQKIKIIEAGYAKELDLIKEQSVKALDLVKQSQQQREIDLQQLVNNRSIRQEQVERERNLQTLANQRAELKQAQDFEAALAQTANAVRSPEAERTYQQQVRDARSKTLQATLIVLRTEGNEQERVRTLALKAIEDEVAGRTRAVDLQLAQFAVVRGERERQVKSVEASSAREVAAIEVASKALERQGALLTARNNLLKATSDAKIGEGDLEIEKLNQALAIRKELEAGIIPYAEYALKIQRLQELGVASDTSTLEIQSRKLEIAKQQSVARLEALTLEQTSAKAALTLEQQKIDLANQRLLIEARIAEFKAKQGVLDARLIAEQTEQNNLKSLDAANLAVNQAKGQQPGRERDRAIADAQSRLAIAKSEAETNRQNAAQGKDLARQQLELANQNTGAVLAQVKSQTEVNRLQVETLAVQQKLVLEQFKAAEAAKMYANEVERAAVAAKKLVSGSQTTISNPQGVQTIPGRAAGGSVSSGQPYVVGEREPELFVPNVSGTVLNREQILKNLGSVSFDAAPFGLAQGAAGGTNNREVVDAVRSLEETIRSRPPTPIVANFNAPDDGGMDKLFALQRSSLRIT